MCVNTINDPKRGLNWKFGVGELRQAVFVLGPDRRRLVLGQREFEPAIGIHVAVGNVMNCLPDSPAARTIRRVELLIV